MPITNRNNSRKGYPESPFDRKAAVVNKTCDSLEAQRKVDRLPDNVERYQGILARQTPRSQQVRPKPRYPKILLLLDDKE
jgi:hypothetical protein